VLTHIHRGWAQHPALRFLLVGLSNTIVGLGTIYALKGFAGFGDAQANLLGYGVGITWSFLLNRSWTFAYRGRSIPALLRFLAVIGVGYIVNLIAVLALARGLNVNGYVAQAVGIPPYTIIVYLGCRSWVFPRKHASDVMEP
jgi:putative flippase GtrA